MPNTMTYVRGEGRVFKMTAGNIVLTTAWMKMTGYNVKLSFFGFKLIELTPKLIKCGIKVSLKVSFLSFERIWVVASRLKLYM